MIKAKRYIILLCSLLILFGCTNHFSMDSKMATTINKQDNSSKVKTIPFAYFFRGFITLTEEQAQLYPHKSCIIENDADWHDFMDKYVPGIPYYLSVDYSTESLVFSVTFPAKPSYSTGDDIKAFAVNENELEPEYQTNNNTGMSNEIYAQNTNGVEHCFVNIVKIAKSEIPKEIKNRYHLGDVFKE